jgi:transcriptional regulator with XRE-family HTH domain
VTDLVSPAVGRRRLAQELRRLRLAADRTILEVAERLECSPGKISRIETGVVGAGIQDVKAMLDLYEVDGGRRERLLELVRQSRKRAWWQAYADVVPPQSSIFYGLEDGATTIGQHTVALVPGLLQTEDYARALIGSPADVTPEEAERRLSLRMRRQRLLDREEPPRIRVVLDEAVLLRLVGGSAVLATQLRRLAELAERPNITIQVLPFDAGAHTAQGTAFVVFGFADPADPKVVYLEQLTRNIHIEDAAEVARYTSALDEASALAQTPEESVETIARRARSLSRDRTRRAERPARRRATPPR